MCRASTFKDAGPTTAVGLQRSITQTDHQCLLPSPALPGAGSTVGTSEVPSQPGPSELPWADSRTPDLPCAQVQLTQTVWQLALPNDRFNHHVLGFGLMAGRGDLATGSGPSIKEGCRVGLMSLPTPQLSSVHIPAGRCLLGLERGRARVTSGQRPVAVTRYLRPDFRDNYDLSGPRPDAPAPVSWVLGEGPPSHDERLPTTSHVLTGAMPTSGDPLQASDLALCGCGGERTRTADFYDAKVRFSAF